VLDTQERRIAAVVPKQSFCQQAVPEGVSDTTNPEIATGDGMPWRFAREPV